MKIFLPIFINNDLKGVFMKKNDGRVIEYQELIVRRLMANLSVIIDDEAKWVKIFDNGNGK